MSLQVEISNVLKEVQYSFSNHQKYAKILEKIYKTADLEDFVETIVGLLRGSVFTTKNEYTEKLLAFLATFTAIIASKNEEVDCGMTSDLFLSNIIKETLATHKCEQESFRYNSCRLINLILKSLGNNYLLEDNICDEIQEIMLQRIYDVKNSVRLEALLAMERLQDPTNSNCPVIKEYCNLLSDQHPTIRAEAVKLIAPLSTIVSYIAERTRDVDIKVQKAAFKKCGNLSMSRFKIEERQIILKNGVHNENAEVHKFFVNTLLLPWFTNRNRDFLEFLEALKFDAIEADFIEWADLSENIMNILFKFIPAEEILQGIPLENNLIPMEKIHRDNIKMVLFWRLVINFFKTSECMKEYFDQVVPDLTVFCDYIDVFVKSKQQGIFENKWETLEYTIILYEFFEIAQLLDHSEEAGRQKLLKLVMSQINKEATHMRVLKKLFVLADSLSFNKEHLMKDILDIINEMLMNLNINGDTPTSSQESTNMKVERNELICNVLNILISALESLNFDKNFSTLKNIVELVVIPLAKNDDNQVSCKVLNVIGLVALIDEEIAKKYAKMLVFPIYMYRSANVDKQHLLFSIKIVCDLFRKYSFDIFENESSEANQQNTTKRKLYCQEDDNNGIITNLNNLYFEMIIDMIVDFTDDSDPEICQCALIALYKMIMDKLSVTPELLSRMLLKWYNPATDLQLQQILGLSVSEYVTSFKDSGENLCRAALIAFHTIASAPKDSPLLEIDTDRLCSYIAVIIQSDVNHMQNYSMYLAEIVCTEILKKKTSSLLTQYLINLLTCLDLVTDNLALLKALKDQIELISEQRDLSKAYKNKLKKFCTKITSLIINNGQREESIDQNAVEQNENRMNQGEVINNCQEQQLETNNGQHLEEASNAHDTSIQLIVKLNQLDLSNHSLTESSKSNSSAIISSSSGKENKEIKNFENLRRSMRNKLKQKGLKTNEKTSTDQIKNVTTNSGQASRQNDRRIQDSSSSSSSGNKEHNKMNNIENIRRSKRVRTKDKTSNESNCNNTIVEVQKRKPEKKTINLRTRQRTSIINDSDSSNIEFTPSGTSSKSSGSVREKRKSSRSLSETSNQEQRRASSRTKNVNNQKVQRKPKKKK